MANDAQKRQASSQQPTPTVGAGLAPALAGKTRRRRRPGPIIARIALLIFFCTGFFLSVFPAGRAGLRTILSLPALLMASEPAPLTVLDEPVRRTSKTIPSRDGPVYLDIYTPTTPAPPIPGSRGGVVMIPGIGDNRNVPQLVNLSLALAHAGLVVINMTTPTLASYNLTAQDSDGVVQVFNLLAHMPGVSASKIGLIGFSGGGPIICFAAADPRIRDQVAFVALFGSYFNATSLLSAVGRRAVTANGQVQPWQPNPFPIQVLANVISATLPPSEGRALQNAFTPGGKPVTRQDLSHFSPATVAAYHLLAGDQPSRVDANLAALPPQAHALLDQLSVNRVLDQIRAPIYLLHDRTDTSVPFTESLDFAAALMRIHHPYDLAEFGIFQHVQVRADLGIEQLLSDSPRLFRILNEVLLPSS
jgi:pimeloyl-ACP methyl ester carboxylesterase